MDAELQTWTDAWNRAAMPDTDDVVACVRRRRTHERWILAGGWAAVAALALLCAIVGDTLTGIADRVALIFVVGFSVLVMTLHSRGILSDAPVHTPREHLEDLRRRLARDVRLGHTWWPAALLVGFLIAWFPWKLAAATSHRIAAAVVAAAVLLALSILGQILQRRQAQTRHAAISALLTELE